MTNYLDPLFNLQEEKNYYTHMGVVAHIVDWSRDFYRSLHEGPIEWKRMSINEKEDFSQAELKQRVLAYGREKMENFVPRHMVAVQKWKHER